MKTVTSVSCELFIENNEIREFSTFFELMDYLKSVSEREKNKWREFLNELFSE